MPSPLPHDLAEPAFDPNAMRVLSERYFAKQADGNMESPAQFLWRVAAAIAASEGPYAAHAGRDADAVVEQMARAFYALLARRDFMPNTPCLVNAGRPLSMLSACFVLPVPDSIEGIFYNLQAMALIQKSGGGTGYAFSELRANGALVESTGKDASGPVSFMKVFNAATDSIKQGGVRRGANMGVLRVDHPDVFHFMCCKKELDSENRALFNRMSDTGRYSPAQLAHMKQELLQTQMNNFNISIGVTDAFMNAVKKDANFDLIDPRTKSVVRTVKAREIWDGIVEGAWQNGEPGVLFLDHPQWNPLPGLGPIHATNPCVTGDTLVAVADGRGHVSIADLAASGDDVPVYCYDDCGNITVRTMRHPRITGKDKAILRIVLDDGSVVRATENHKFRLRDGTYVAASELFAGASLALMTRYEESPQTVISNSTKTLAQDTWWIDNGGKFREAEHRYMAQIDRRPATKVSAGNEISKSCEGCGTSFWINHEYREVGFCSHRCWLVQMNKSPKALVQETSSKRARRSLRHAEVRERQLDVYTELKAYLGGSVPQEQWQQRCIERGISPEIARPKSPFCSYHQLESTATWFNHRVVSVALDGYADVYNGTVDEFHNFFLGGFEQMEPGQKRRIHYINSKNCGEQALHGYDSCNLGSLNVGHFYNSSTHAVDWDRLGSAVALSIRFLDNVIDANIYPIDEIKVMVTNNRRVGLGIMGFADLLIQLRIAYGSPEAIDLARQLMQFMQTQAEDASEVLARERGEFPNKHLSIWAGDPRPRRNAALLSIAPTGTISMIAGCSFGCEPYFGIAYTKHVMKDAEGRPQHLYYVLPLFEEIAKDEGFFSEELLAKVEQNRGSLKGIAEVPAIWQEIFTVAADVSVDQHIDMLAAFQEHTCNAVSKTINAPNDDTRENVARSIFRAYESGCKGFTYYRDGSRTEQVVTFSKDADISGVNRDAGATAGTASENAITAAEAIVKDATAIEPLDVLLARAKAVLGEN